jgi:drug/metabolite transporter (DMT)-like permease
MSIGIIYALSALLSFGALGVLHKLADTKHCRPSAITVLLAFSSLVLSGLLLLTRGHSLSAAPKVIWIALPFGVSAMLAIYAFQAGVRHGSIATSWLAINLSAGIPTLGSIFLYGEPVGRWTVVALLLIPVSMALLWMDKKQHEAKLLANDALASAPHGLREQA